MSFAGILAAFGEPPDTVPDKMTAESGPDGKEKWFVIKSTNFKIYCAQDTDISGIARRLERRGLFVSGVYGPNPASAPSEKIAYRMDMILKRAKEILDMYPQNMNLNIKIYSDRRQLDNEYYRIFRRDVDYISFYIHQYETIYTSEEDLSDSVIAHEMGHAIIDHYFSAIPPPKVAELLAQYVDKHLED